MHQTTMISGIANDTFQGLSASPKYLLPKYFYDDIGSRIFQDIMKMPEYYLTDCEMEIFSSQKKQIIEAFQKDVNNFNLVELGAGDGLKTKVLLEHLIESSVHFKYIPIDISKKTNDDLVKELNTDIPALHVDAKTGDYFDIMDELNQLNGTRKVILFLGANIGNYSPTDIAVFLQQLSSVTHPGDKVLIGFDMKKSPEAIKRAYDDPHGHSRRFALNHLDRINKELGANFKINHFEHHITYSPYTGMVKSYLVSNCTQTIRIEALEQNIDFKQWEPIFMELSQKFDIKTIQQIASNAGFEIEYNFTDSRNYFVDSLWKRI